MKLNVILRVCDIVSLCSNKVVDKVSCIKLCVPRLIESLENYNNYELTILNDRSSTEITTFLHSLTFKGVIIELANREDSNLTGLQKSRYSVGIQYSIAKTLPENELVYFVEDDFLHYTDSIQKMVDNYLEFSSWEANVHIGIFAEDFKQLHFHPNNRFNSTYIEPSVTITGIDRYFKTVSYTHESYMISTNCLKEYFNDLYSITTIGFENTWEGDTFCTVWRKYNVKMLMPLGGFILHLDTEENMPNFIDWRKQIGK